jgi:hypothetical protein
MAHTPDDADRPRDETARPARAWEKPALVEYGHLAKLTRGSSGNITEAGGKMRCL